MGVMGVVKLWTTKKEEGRFQKFAMKTHECSRDGRKVFFFFIRCVYSINRFCSLECWKADLVVCACMQAQLESKLLLFL